MLQRSSFFQVGAPEVPSPQSPSGPTKLSTVDRSASTMVTASWLAVEPPERYQGRGTYSFRRPKPFRPVSAQSVQPYNFDDGDLSSIRVALPGREPVIVARPPSDVVPPRRMKEIDGQQPRRSQPLAQAARWPHGRQQQRDQQPVVRATKRRFEEVEEKPERQVYRVVDDPTYYDDDLYEKTVELLKAQKRTAEAELRLAELEFERAKRRRMNFYN